MKSLPRNGVVVEDLVSASIHRAEPWKVMIQIVIFMSEMRKFLGCQSRLLAPNLQIGQQLVAIGLLRAIQPMNGVIPLAGNKPYPWTFEVVERRACRPCDLTS